MPCFRDFALRLALIALLGTLPSASWGLSLTEKANLQATMQRYIDQQTVDGVFIYLEARSGKVRTLHPVSAHTRILSVGQYYVLCFDFRDDKGQDVNVDFYLARKNTSYVVFHTGIDDREQLKRMMQAG